MSDATDVTGQVDPRAALAVETAMSAPDLYTDWAVRQQSSGRFILMRAIDGVYHDEGEFYSKYMAERCAALLREHALFPNLPPKVEQT